MALRPFSNWLAIVCTTVLITACGGGGGGGGSSAAATAAAGNGTSSSPSAGGSASGGSSSAPIPPAINRAVQLSWTAPATRADGTALTVSELSGYRVYYALEGSSAAQDTVVPVSGGSTTSLQVTLNSLGTYTFAITALDQDGQESSLSAPVSVAIN